MRELLIRFAEEDDEASCAALDTRIPSYFLTRRIEQREVIVADLEGEVVACLRFEFLGSSFPLMSLLAVRPDLGDEGIAAHLVEFLEEYLRELGFNSLMCSASEGDSESEAWYRSLGFHECGFLAGLRADGGGDIFFRKRLD